MARSNLQPPNGATLGLGFMPATHRTTYADINPAVHPAPCAGKTVLVTGAARGIGQATVISFAAAGADRIAIVDAVDASATRAQALQAAADAGRPAPEILVLEFDGCDSASVDAGINELKSRWGHVDILINTSGDLSSFESQPLGASVMDDWWRTLEVNIKGIYLVLRALLPLLFQGTEKTIVIVISGGSPALIPGASAHQLSKLAVMRLSECLMLDYAHKGLLAYSVYSALDLTNGVLGAVSNGLRIDHPDLVSDTLTYLTRERRDWLARRHVSSEWDMREFMARKEEIVQNDLLKLNVSFEVASACNETRVPYQRIKGRVPRSSY